MDPSIHKKAPFIITVKRIISVKRVEKAIFLIILTKYSNFKKILSIFFKIFLVTMRSGPIKMNSAGFATKLLMIL